MQQFIQIAQIAFYTTAILGAIVATITYIIGLKASVKNLEVRFDLLEKRFDLLEKRFDSLENRFNSLENRFNSLEKKVDTLIMHLIGSNPNDKDVK